MPFGLIARGKVVQVSDAMFPVSTALSWGPAQSDVQVGDGFDGTAYTRPAVPVPPAPTLSDRLAALAVERYARQTAGVAFKASGASAASVAASDPVSTGLITASYVAARDGHWTDGTPWKMVNGTFVPLTAADMQALALTVLGYVSACYAHEGALATALAGDLTTDITAGWPPNA